MPKTTYTVPAVPGSSRTSERPYTHAIVGRDSPALQAAHRAADFKANAAKYARWDAKLWHDNKRLAQCPSGGMYLNSNGYLTTPSDAVIKIGTDFIASFPTPEGYLAYLKAQREADVARGTAAPDGELAVLQWSMSYANAWKAHGTWCKTHVDVRVVECVPVAKPARKAKAEA